MAVACLAIAVVLLGLRINRHGFRPFSRARLRHICSTKKSLDSPSPVQDPNFQDIAGSGRAVYSLPEQPGFG